MSHETLQEIKYYADMCKLFPDLKYHSQQLLREKLESLNIRCLNPQMGDAEYIQAFEDYAKSLTYEFEEIV